MIIDFDYKMNFKSALLNEDKKYKHLNYWPKYQKLQLQMDYKHSRNIGTLRGIY